MPVRLNTYRAFGILLLALLFWMDMVGWTFMDVDEVAGVPRSVRDNPGAYRAHYQSHARYSGGK